LNGNPYLGQVIGQLNRGVGDTVNSQFENLGRYGSGAHADVLSRNLADADAGLLYQNYGDEMARMADAAEGAQRGNAADISALLAAIGANAEIPYTGSNNLANSLGALFSGGNEKSKQTGTSPLWGAVGAGLGALGSVFG
jgi:hypothetical protein